MYSLFRRWAKYIVSIAPFALTKNERYDRLTERVIKRVCNADSVCIDVGANQGKILEMFVKHCPAAMHFAFEPIPLLFKLLVRKFGSACSVYQVALSNKKGRVSFNVAEADMAYSSFKKREDIHLNNRVIEVESDLLDNIISAEEKITLIKIDVEGAEYSVLSGAKRTLAEHKPFILFEFGLGGSNAYQITPKLMFDFFEDLGYHVNLLHRFLAHRQSLNFNNFQKLYDKGTEYFFIASSVADDVT